MCSKLSLLTRRKSHLHRSSFKALSFLVLIAGAYLVKSLSSNNLNGESSLTDGIKTFDQEDISRLLLEINGSVNNSTEIVDHDACQDKVKVENKVLLIPYIFGVLYMFFAIAIVCDEFFVPSLEEIASERHMNLSMDVAGATLMAAGGSAPELFTALIGTFQESEVGFGTVVGSAVFNVLFVIGMCAMFSKEVLALTWWPLARDCAYYTIGLIVLACFCGYSSPGKIELWEAIVQFLLYFGYVLVMKFNEKIYIWIRMNYMKTKVSDSETCRRITPVPPQTRFRAGLLKLLIRNRSLLDKVGITMVSRMSGDVETVFSKFDEKAEL